MVDRDNIIAALIVILFGMIPLIPILLIWILLHPIGFWQNLTMLFVSIMLYLLFGFIELTLIGVASK